jgi:hypothetical protein
MTGHRTLVLTAGTTPDLVGATLADEVGAVLAKLAVNCAVLHPRRTSSAEAWTQNKFRGATRQASIRAIHQSYPLNS